MDSQYVQMDIMIVNGVWNSGCMSIIIFSYFILLILWALTMPAMAVGCVRMQWLLFVCAQHETHFHKQRHIRSIKLVHNCMHLNIGFFCYLSYSDIKMTKGTFKSIGNMYSINDCWSTRKMHLPLLLLLLLSRGEKEEESAESLSVRNLSQTQSQMQHRKALSMHAKRCVEWQPQWYLIRVLYIHVYSHKRSLASRINLGPFMALASLVAHSRLYY